MVRGMIIVRAARTDDWYPAADIHVRGWQATYRGHMPDAFLDGLTPESHSGWRERLYRNPHPRMRHVVAVDGRTVVGFADVGDSRSDDDAADGEVFAIYVDPDRFGTGVGRRLILGACATLRTLGKKRAELWVLRENERARRFYSAGGWAADGADKTEVFEGRQVVEVRYLLDL